MRSESLIVNNKTSLADLQAFANKLGDNMHIRGKKVSGGIELYAKTESPSRWSNFFGKAKSERSNAKAAVEKVFTNTERTIGGKTLGNVREAMNTGIQGKEVKGNALKFLVDSAQRKATSSGNVADNRGPGLDRFPKDIRKALINDAMNRANAFAGQDNLTHATYADEVSKSIGDAIDSMRNKPNGDKVLDRLGLSSAAAFKFDLRNAMAKEIPMFGTDDGRRIMDLAFDQLTEKLFPNHETANNEIKIGGKTYEKREFLGNGAYGSVHAYRNKDDHSDKIALKTFDSSSMSANAKAYNLAAFKNEANVHRSGQGGGHENVVGFGGAVRLQNGDIGIALEFAKHGNATQVTDDIRKKVGPNLAPKAAQNMTLTLLKDMAQGLAHIQRGGKDIIHFDMKAENVFVGGEGKAMVGDFGLSVKAERFDVTATDISDNPSQVSPELHKMRKAMEDNNTGATLTTRKQQYADNVGNLFQNLNDEQKTELLNDAKNAVKLNSRVVDRQRPDPRAADAWALGNAAFTMIFGRPMAQHKFMFESSNRISQFGDNPGNRAIDTTRLDSVATDWSGRTDGAFAGSTGDHQLDSLLNGLLHPDPTQRLTVSEALKHPALTSPAVGSAATRNLMKAFLEKDTDTMRQLQGLPPQNQVNQPPPVQNNAQLANALNDSGNVPNNMSLNDSLQLDLSNNRNLNI